MLKKLRAKDEMSVIDELVMGALAAIDQLRAQGLKGHLINEIVLPEYIFVPEEGGLYDEDEDWDCSKRRRKFAP